MAEEEKSWWDSLFSNEEAKEREMVMSPPPVKPELNPDDYSDNLAYRMAKRKADNEYKRLMEDREYNPGKYMVQEAEAEPTEDIRKYDRRQAIDEAISEAEGQ
jgi:hypothetical protein